MSNKYLLRLNHHPSQYKISKCYIYILCCNQLEVIQFVLQNHYNILDFLSFFKTSAAVSPATSVVIATDADNNSLILSCLF